MSAPKNKRDVELDANVIKSKRTYKLDQESFNFLKNIALTISGLKLQKNADGVVYNRISRRLHELKLPDFAAYCDLIKVNESEKEIFINLISNPLTSFFRDKHHFHYLEYTLLPELLRTKSKLRIWSIGCSTGEEPYSIAIIINNVVPKMQDVDIKILATDINSDSLEIAKQGIYESDTIAHLNMDIRNKYFYHGIGSNLGLIKVNNSIRNLVHFQKLNLIDEWPLTNPFDIIFCRNVLIYLSKELIPGIIDRLDKLLVPNGVLFLGHTESAIHLPKKYNIVGKTIYRKPVVNEGNDDE
jgi:chemotaxis protein methyltransferase CheR